MLLLLRNQIELVMDRVSTRTRNSRTRTLLIVPERLASLLGMDRV